MLVGYDRFVGEHAYWQLAGLYRPLRLYMKCFQPSMKLLSKHREGKKCATSTMRAKTPLHRLLMSGILSGEKHHELNAVVQSLDPLRLLEQLVQLQKSLFRSTAEGNPFISHTSSLPIHSVSVEQCTTEVAPVEVSLPDSPAGLTALFQGQEKRKRVHCFRRTHKDPLQGSGSKSYRGWSPIQNDSLGDIFREQRCSPGRYQPVHIRTREPRDAQDPGPSGTETREEQWQEEVIPRTILLANFREILCQLTLVALK
jgi:hypothetical protein